MQTKHMVLAGLAMFAVSTVAIAGQSPAGGTVSGIVSYEGKPAKMKPIEITRDASCAKMYKNMQAPLAEDVVIGPGKSLRVMSQNYDQTVLIDLPTGNAILGRPAAEAVWLRPERSS